MATIKVKPGSLVRYREVGIQVNCDTNDPEFGNQPFVTVNTEDLPAHHVDGNGVPMISVHLNDATIYNYERGSKPEIRVTEGVYALLEEIVNDACYYRQGEAVEADADDDPDIENDFKQIAKYRELLARFKHE